MLVVKAENLACPIDGLPLVVEGASQRCSAGHSYDIAREGYANLLVVQHKASRDPGDSKEMVAARHRFLDAGHYAPIADAVFDSICSTVAACHTLSCNPIHVLDAGCGEGYYLDHLSKLAAQCPDPGTLAFAGIDVSKWAIKAAARRSEPVTWLVANNRRPPFIAGSIELIICLFGFPVWEGFRAVQPAGGHVLLVDPGPCHLIELREIIYPAVVQAEVLSSRRNRPEGYDLETQTTQRFQAQLATPQAIQDLLAMTPHAHRITQAGRDALAQRSTLTVTVDVILSLFKRGSGPRT
jgi:23S rRNA (guanine745-N1)-methyltransferase